MDGMLYNVVSYSHLAPHPSSLSSPSIRDSNPIPDNPFSYQITCVCGITGTEEMAEERSRYSCSGSHHLLTQYTYILRSVVEDQLLLEQPVHVEGVEGEEGGGPAVEGLEASDGLACVLGEKALTLT